MSGLVNVEVAEHVEIDADTSDDLREALQAGSEVEFKVVKIRCQLPNFAVGSSR